MLPKLTEFYFGSSVNFNTDFFKKKSGFSRLFWDNFG